MSISPAQLDEVIVILRYLYHDAEAVYEERSIEPHYVEMDAVMSALSSAAGQVVRAREELERVIHLDVKARYND